jgi:hypothetical protein
MKQSFKNNDPEAERREVLVAAASILRQDTCTQICETKYYTPSTCLFDNLNEYIPESIIFFVDELILKNKKGKIEPLRKKSTTLCHVIMTALRPRAFASNLQLGLSVYLHRQFGSQKLIDILSYLGLAATYKETSLYEASALFHPQPRISSPDEGCFIQYVTDNADHNVATINGFNTFHSMGMIRIITPHDKMESETKMIRLKKLPTEEEMFKVARIPIKFYEIIGIKGLKKVTVQNIDCNEISTSSMLRNADVLWLYAKWNNVENIPGWSGYMENLTVDEPYSKSRILFFAVHKSSSE